MNEPQHKSFLCIGGPLDGKRYDSKSGAGFRVPLMPELALEYPPAEQIKTVSVVHYRAETFHTPQGDVSFWTPEGQTPLQTITMLLEAYERMAIEREDNDETECE